jgi:hypothetical protein
MEGIKDSISQHNANVYFDIAKDMLAKKDGLFSFIIRVDGKHIVDYVQLESFMYAELKIINWKTKL